MGAGVFLDSDRTVISSQSSPDGRRVAQVERIVVGGVPSIVVTVRPSWKPNWYLSSCAAASHYEEASAKIAWASASELKVSSKTAPLSWEVGTAPFHDEPCANLVVSIFKA